MEAAFENGVVEAIRARVAIGCSRRSSQPAGTSVSVFKIATWPLVTCIAALTVSMKPRLPTTGQHADVRSVRRRPSEQLRHFRIGTAIVCQQNAVPRVGVVEQGAEQPLEVAGTVVDRHDDVRRFHQRCDDGGPGQDQVKHGAEARQGCRRHPQRNHAVDQQSPSALAVAPRQQLERPAQCTCDIAPVMQRAARQGSFRQRPSPRSHASRRRVREIREAAPRWHDRARSSTSRSGRPGAPPPARRAGARPPAR